MNQSTCIIEGCEKPAKNAGKCWGHYEATRVFRVACGVDGCVQPARKRGWCGSHYSRWLRNGSVADADQSWVWASVSVCATCGDGIPDAGEFRRYCSRSCAVMQSARPMSAECSQCGAEIDLLARHSSGRRKYRNASTCDRCRPPHMQPRIPAIVERDGTVCALCGAGVDLGCPYPDPMSPSVDHIKPFSRGGSHDLANLQLAHLRCNVIKSNREGFSLIE